MTYIGENAIYPNLSSTEIERYKDIAREIIQEHPYIRYGQALVIAIAHDYTIIYPELFYCRDEQKVEQLLKVMEINEGI